MPSYLSVYEGSSTDRINKFHRAIERFLKQDYEQKELVVVSDGCDYTDTEILKYQKHDCIKHIRLPKAVQFCGENIQQGIKIATGEYICYLDTDDFFGESNHLSSIVQAFEKNDVDWIFMNNYFGDGIHIDGVKKTILEFGSVGTSSIAHKKNVKSEWTNCDGWGHDWMFIQKLINDHPNHLKINAGSYRICHIKNLYEV